MFALHAASRTLLAAASFASFGGAFVTTPLVARVDAAAVAEPAPAVATLPPRTTFADVIPRRDPFAGGDIPAAHVGALSPALQTTTNTSANPALPPIPAALRALPPNAGAGDGAFPFATAARTTAVVTAVVTGTHPFALVDEGGATRMLTVGDRIGADAIAAIGADGVRLTGGTLLPVARSSDPVVPLQAPAGTVPPPSALPTPTRSISGGP
jgi:hypothetical protein